MKAGGALELRCGEALVTVLLDAITSLGARSLTIRSSTLSLVSALAELYTHHMAQMCHYVEQV